MDSDKVARFWDTV